MFLAGIHIFRNSGELVFYGEVIPNIGETCAQGAAAGDPSNLNLAALLT